MNIWGRFKQAVDVFRGRSLPPGEPIFSGVGGQGFWTDQHINQVDRLLRYFTGSRIDYEKEVGDLSMSSLVMAAVAWLGTALPEAPLEVAELQDANKFKVVKNHPLPALWAQPNQYYSGELLWKAFAASWFIDGNVYILKVRDLTGKVVELWYLPHWMVEPQWPMSGVPFISHYLYCVDGREYIIDRQDILHFRYGLDPDNPRKGRSPAKCVMRELYGDHEAANFSAQLLHNFGIPGVIISPKGDKLTIKKEDREEIKGEFDRKFRGDGRGSAMVLSGQIEATTLSFDPSKLMMIEQRRISEERWSAVIRLPAAVLGFGSGMAQTKVGATMRELREQAAEEYLIPTQRVICGDLRVQILVDFDGPKSARVVRFNNSEVRVLQDDVNKLWERLTKAWVSDEITLDQLLEAKGYPPDTHGFGELRYSQFKAMFAPKLAEKKPEEEEQMVNGKDKTKEAD